MPFVINRKHTGRSCHGIRACQFSRDVNRQARCHGKGATKCDKSGMFQMSGVRIVPAVTACNYSRCHGEEVYQMSRFNKNSNCHGLGTIRCQGSVTLQLSWVNDVPVVTFKEYTSYPVVTGLKCSSCQGPGTLLVVTGRPCIPVVTGQDDTDL